MRRYTALESAAAYGSVSYGRLPPARLKAILLGEAPRGFEDAQVYQALAETPLYRLCTLARELGIPFSALEDRARGLFGQTLEEMQRCTPGSGF